MEALKVSFVGVLRASYDVTVDSIVSVVGMMRRETRFQSPLSPSDFNKILTEICVSAPDNGRDKAKMIVSLVVQTSVTSQRDGLMVVNNDNQLVDRFLDSLYNDSSNKDDIALIKKAKQHIVSVLNQDKTTVGDANDDEEQQYDDDEEQQYDDDGFEPESPKRLNETTDNEISKYLNMYDDDEFQEEDEALNDSKKDRKTEVTPSKHDDDDLDDKFNKLLEITTSSMRQSLKSQGISIIPSLEMPATAAGTPKKEQRIDENDSQNSSVNANIEAKFEVIRMESMSRKISSPMTPVTTDVSSKSMKSSVASTPLPAANTDAQSNCEVAPHTPSNLKISFTSPTLDGNSDMLMIKRVEIDDNSVGKSGSNGDPIPSTAPAHHVHEAAPVQRVHATAPVHRVHEAAPVSHSRDVPLPSNTEVEASPSKQRYSVFATRPNNLQHTHDFAAMLRPNSSGAMYGGKKMTDKKSKTVDQSLYLLQELVHAKVKEAKELIGFGDNYWREKLFAELEDNLEALKLKHEKDLASIKIRHQLGGYDYKPRVADAVDEISDVRYKNFRSKLLVEQKEEIERMRGSIAVPLAKLDDIILLQTESIDTSLSKADLAMSHYVKLAESHKNRINHLAVLRLKSANAAARIALQATLRVIENICKKIRANYKGVSTHNGPIHTSLPLRTRLRSALNKCAYPKCVVGDRRLPTLPAEATNPPKSLNYSSYRRQHTHKRRPKSAPSGNNNAFSKKSYKMARPQSATATAIHARRHNNPNFEFLTDQNNPNMLTSSQVLMGLTPADVGVEAANETAPRAEEAGATTDNEYHYDDDFYRDDGFIQEENYADDTFEYNDMLLYDTFDYDSQIGDAPIFDDYNNEEKFERKKYSLKRRKKNKKKRNVMSENASFPSQDVQNSRATRDSNIDSALTGTDLGTNSSYPWNENPCSYCKRDYRGIGKTLPTPFTLDKKITSKVRTAHQALMGGLKANKEKLTARQLQDIKYTEILRNKYHIEYPKVEEFCSWKCVKCYMKLKVPLQHQYEYSVLIDLTAGKLIE